MIAWLNLLSSTMVTALACDLKDNLLTRINPRYLLSFHVYSPVFAAASSSCFDVSRLEILARLSFAVIA